MTRVAWSQVFTFGSAQVTLPRPRIALASSMAVAVGAPAPVIPSVAATGVPTPGTPAHTHLIGLLDLVETMETSARSATRQREWNDAGEHYGKVLDLVGRPSTPMRTEIEAYFLAQDEGDSALHEYQRHAVGEYVAYASPADKMRMLTDLHVLQGEVVARRDGVQRLLEHIDQEQMKGVSFTAKVRAARLHQGEEKLRGYADARAALEERRTVHVDALQGLARRMAPLKDFVDTTEQSIAHKRSLVEDWKEYRSNFKRSLDSARWAAHKLERKTSNDRIAMLEGEIASEREQAAIVDGRMVALEQEHAALKQQLSAIDVEIRDVAGERFALYMERDALRSAMAGHADWIGLLKGTKRREDQALHQLKLAEASLGLRYAAQADEVVRAMQRYTGETKSAPHINRVENYEETERVVRELERSSGETSLYGRLLIVESLARQVGSAHQRGDVPALDRLIGKLNKVVQATATNFEDTDREQVNLVGEILSNIAQHYADLGLMDSALALFHRLGTSEAYRSTNAVDELMRSNDFESYVPDLEKEIARIRDVEQRIEAKENNLGSYNSYAALLEERNPSPEFGRRGRALRRGVKSLRAALRNAHYKSRHLEPLGVGGSAAWAAAETQYRLTGRVGIVPPALAAMASTTVARLYHGLRSPEARSAWRTGVYKRGAKDTAWKDTAWDAASVGARAGLGALFWMLPAMFMATGYNESALMAQTAGRIKNAYLNALWAVPLTAEGGALGMLAYSQGIEPSKESMRIVADRASVAAGGALYGARDYLKDQAWTKAMFDTSFAQFVARHKGLFTAGSMGLGALGLYHVSPTSLDALYKLYMAATGLVFGAYTLIPSKRQELQKLAGYFVPGAILLSAHLGINIRGDAEWSVKHFERLAIGSFGVIEGIAMLFTSGTVPLPFGGKDGTAPSLTSAKFWKTLGHGIKYDANHMAMVAIAITVGISSALGKLFLGDINAKDLDVSTIVTLGAMTTLGLLPMTLLASGVAKQQIPIIPAVRESWKDTEDEKSDVARIGHAAASAAHTFASSPYTWNRALRVPTLDLPAAAMRTFIGWDTFLGYLPVFAINFLFGNPTATMMRPETAGTPWQHDPFHKAIFTETESGRQVIDQAKFADLLGKAPRHMSGWHWQLFGGNRTGDAPRQIVRWARERVMWRRNFEELPTTPFPQGIKAWAYPFAGFRRVFAPPAFPMRRQVPYLAELYLYLTGQAGTEGKDRLTLPQLRQILDEMECLAANPANFEKVRPILQVLYLARSPEGESPDDSVREASELALGDALPTDTRRQEGPDTPVYRRMIDGWFAERPWLVKHMFLATGQGDPVDDKTRFGQRLRVRKNLYGEKGLSLKARIVRRIFKPFGSYAPMVDEYVYGRGHDTAPTLLQ